MPDVASLVDMLPEFTLMNLFALIGAGVMIIGGVFPYIPQYFDISKSGNTDGFSTDVCLTLLIANLLRIYFWFGKRFELPLLTQSIIMVIAMMLLMELCVRVKRKTEHQAVQRRFLDLQWRYVWRWTHFSSYLQFVLLVCLALGVVTYSLLDVSLYVESIGFLAVFAEALIGLPQFYRNWQNHSTDGMSKKMVLMWTSGDTFKTVYFVLREAPAQFWMCGALQICVDIAIFGQVFYYGWLIKK